MNGLISFITLCINTVLGKRENDSGGNEAIIFIGIIACCVLCLLLMSPLLNINEDDADDLLAETGTHLDNLRSSTEALDDVTLQEIESESMFPQVTVPEDVGDVELLEQAVAS